MAPIVVHKPMRIVVLGQGFGPPIYLLVGFLIILWVWLQTPTRWSNLYLFCELLDLHTSPSGSSSSSFFTHTPCLCFHSFPNFFQLFQFFFFNQPPLFAFPLLIQSLFSRILIIIISPILMHLHFCQNPKKPSCLLRIRLKLVLEAKQRSVASSPKALTTLGNRLQFNHFFIYFPPPHQWQQAEHYGIPPNDNFYVPIHVLSGQAHSNRV